MIQRARGPSYERPESLQDPLDPQHHLMLSSVKGSNGKKLRVRCKCMAEYKNVDTRRYFIFDHITDVDSLDQARKIYDDHLRASTILVAVAKFYQKQEMIDATHSQLGSKRLPEL